MWRLESIATPEHTTFIYNHLKPNLDAKSFGFGDSDAYFSKEELAKVQEQWGSMVVDSKFLMKFLMSGFASIKDQLDNFMLLSYMDVDPTSHYYYEQMELVNFMPGHKNNMLMKGWALYRIITPQGENEPDYLKANFFENVEAIYRNSDGVAQLSKQQKMNYQKLLSL